MTLKTRIDNIQNELWHVYDHIETMTNPVLVRDTLTYLRDVCDFEIKDLADECKDHDLALEEYKNAHAI